MEKRISEAFELLKKLKMPILTARQKNKVDVGRIDCPDGSVISSNAFKMRWINKYNAYAKHQVADEGGDLCEEDEIDFFHEEALENEPIDDDEEEPLNYPIGAPKTGGASPKTGGASATPTPSPDHYRAWVSPKGDAPKDHKCEEGMTELGGWIICKHCGVNLRKI